MKHNVSDEVTLMMIMMMTTMMIYNDKDDDSRTVECFSNQFSDVYARNVYYQRFK